MMKKVLFAIFSCAIVQAQAETVFRTDGTILSGSIVREENSAISIRSADGKTVRVPRPELLRVLYTDIYMGKVYVRYTDGSVLEAYQVDQDKENYIFRRDIAKPEEISVPRKQIMFITRTNPSDLKGKAGTDRVELTWSAPFKPPVSYRIYRRMPAKGKDLPFETAASTTGTAYTLKDLAPASVYDVYVTAIGESGDESLPSDRIIVKTRPEAPRGLNAEKSYSKDETRFTAALTWTNDTDAHGMTWAVYRRADESRSRLAATKESSFAIANLSASESYDFAVRAVDADGVESEDAKIRVKGWQQTWSAEGSGAFLGTSGRLARIASSGYGGSAALFSDWKYIGAGIETGWYAFDTKGQLYRSFSMLPCSAVVRGHIALTKELSMRPSLSAGLGFVSGRYSSYGRMSDTHSTDGLFGAGLHLGWNSGGWEVFCGASYRVLAERGGYSGIASLTAGAAAVF